MRTRKVTTLDWTNIAKALQIPTEDVQFSCPSLAVLVCGAGTKIVREGEPGVDVFIVGKGALAVKHSVFLVLSKDVARLKPGDFFGEVGFLVSQGRTATVETVDSCEVYRILADEMAALLERHPEVRARLEESARQRIQSLSSAVS